MVRFNLEIRADQAGPLEELADRLGTNRAAIVRQFIDEGLEREERRRKRDRFTP